MRWFASVWRCSTPFFSSIFLFHLVHCESFHVEYLAALAFLQLLLHRVDAGELCLTEQPLALLHSKRLTAVFFHLRLPRTSFRVCRLLHVDQPHTKASTIPYIQVVYPSLTSPLLSLRKTQYWFLFLLILSSFLSGQLKVGIQFNPYPRWRALYKAVQAKRRMSA